VTSPSATAVWAARSVWARWPARALLAAALLVATLAALRGGHVDLEVYERAGERWIAGLDPYAVRPEYPFTYPPFAAVLAAAVALAPSLCLVVLGVTTAGAAAWAAQSVWLSDPDPADGTDGAAVLATARADRLPVVLALAVGSEPVLRGLHLGQVNGVVVGLVLVDLLVVPARHRGWLTGLAAGLKLTPLVFGLHLAVRREGRALAHLALGFVLTVVVGLVALPRSAVRFWSELVVRADRVGDPGYVDNQSLLGAVTRAVPGPAVPVWVVAGVVVLGLAVVALVRRRSRTPVEGVVVAGLTGLLISPISWSHHWLLLPAAGLLCWREGARLVGALTVVVAVTAPQWSTALTGLPGPVGQLAASSVTVAGVACLAALARPAPAPTARSRPMAQARSGRSSGELVAADRMPTCEKTRAAAATTASSTRPTPYSGSSFSYVAPSTSGGK
jgi:alpha-1,2-mannosyltransferase